MTLTHLGDQELQDLELSVVPGVVQRQAAVYVSVHIKALELNLHHISFYYTKDRRVTYLSLDHLLDLIQVTILHSPGKVTHFSSENMDFYCVGVLMF